MCSKSMGDRVKYCKADPRIDYLGFLEEYRKAENGGKVVKPRP